MSFDTMIGAVVGVASAGLVIYPIWRILRRMGWGVWASLGWLVAFAIPVVGLLAWWYLAFTAWPTTDG